MPDVTASSIIHHTRVAPALPEAMIGRLVAVDESGAPVVDWPGCPTVGGQPAISTAHCGPDSIGSTVVLLFSDGDPLRPIVVGVVRDSDATPENRPPGQSRPDHGDELEAVVDGKRAVISAAEEIVLQCGKASITLTKAGKIIQRGTYVLSRSSGAHKIKGGSIELN